MKTFDKLSKLDGNAQAPQVYMEATIAHCCRLAREILSEHDLDLGEAGGITRLCLFQPHLHKKGIMFSAFIFSIVIAEMLGIEYLWSSDSDTIIMPDSLRSTIETIAGDPHVGGGSSGLIVHNENDTVTTKLGSVVYWSELYMTRSTSTASGTSDCQSGPSTAFRVCALPAVLYPWYTQTVLGHRMVVNEDRHLTTNLDCNRYANNTEPLDHATSPLEPSWAHRVLPAASNLRPQQPSLLLGCYQARSRTTAWIWLHLVLPHHWSLFCLLQLVRRRHPGSIHRAVQFLPQPRQRPK